MAALPPTYWKPTGTHNKISLTPKGTSITPRYRLDLWVVIINDVEMKNGSKRILGWARASGKVQSKKPMPQQLNEHMNWEDFRPTWETTQVLNLETKLYISRQGTARCSRWTQLNSRRITICIYSLLCYYGIQTIEMRGQRDAYTLDLRQRIVAAYQAGEQSGR